MTTVPVTHTDRVFAGRLHLSSEAECPYCGHTNAYRHIETYYSDGQLYACEHATAIIRAGDGLIESIEFKTKEKANEYQNE